MAASTTAKWPETWTLCGVTTTIVSGAAAAKRRPISSSASRVGPGANAGVPCGAIAAATITRRSRSVRAGARRTHPRRRRHRRRRSARDRCGASGRRRCGRGVSSDSSSTSTFSRSVVTIPGRNAWASATASWIGAPSQPYVRAWYCLKKSTSSATNVPTRPASRKRSAHAGVRSASWVTSSPIIVTSSPEWNTRCAASGSAQMLNSAAGVMFPSAIAPPISTMRSRSDAAVERLARRWSAARPARAPSRASRGRRGSRRRSARPARRRGPAARGRRGRSRRGRGRRRASSRTSGRSAPAATGTSVRPTSCEHAAARCPSSCRASGCRASVVTPTSSISGLASASRSAIASSWPGSQSRMTGVVTAGVCASTSSAVGREGCAPKREAASAPAAQERRSASSRARALEQRDEQAGGERVAGGRAVDRVDAAAARRGRPPPRPRAGSPPRRRA